MGYDINIKLFGKFAVEGEDGQPIAVTGAKTQGLIAYLALNTEMPPSRDRLMALFWGDRFTDQARQSLRQAIAKLRRIFGELSEDALIADNDRVGLNPAVVSVDVDDFSALADSADAQDAEKAVAFLTGPLLEGFFGQQSEFEDWIASERQRFATLALSVYERAAEAAMKAGRAREATDLAQRMVALDPLRDGSQAVLIRILAQQGERAAAVQQFNAHEALLQKELGVGAGPDLQRLIAEVKGESFMAEEVRPAQKVEAAPVGGRPTGRTSIAVVPFATLSSEGDHLDFAEGLTEDLTTNLSRFSWLAVKASVENHGSRLTSEQLSALGHELGLDYVLHGSLRVMGEKLRLTAQLANPATSRYVWVMRYDRTTDDLFALQDDLADTITGSVEAELERLVGRGTRRIDIDDMSAWECYHRGLAIQYEFDADTNREAQRHFQRAVELDPNFGLAYARLSYAIVISCIYFEAPDVKAKLDAALDHARMAARLEPDDAVVRFALGRVHLARGEYDRSIADLRAAVDLNPGLAQAHCGLGDSMAYSGALDDAIECFEEAVRISPADPYRWAFLSYGATAFLFKGAYDKAVEWASEAASVPNAHYWPTAIRASALAHADRMDEAREAVAKLVELRPGITCEFVRERLFYLKDEAQIDAYVSGLAKAGLA